MVSNQTLEAILCLGATISLIFPNEPLGYVLFSTSQNLRLQIKTRTRTYVTADFETFTTRLDALFNPLNTRPF